MRVVLVIALVAACGSPTAPSSPGTPPTAQLPPTSIGVSVRDAVGYFSGNYHTVHNNPAIYADRARGVIVMMGQHAALEIPIATPPEQADADFEAFLLANGYAANGKDPADVKVRLVIDRAHGTIVNHDELIPTMPPELRARFTDEQFDSLEHTALDRGYPMVARIVVLLWCALPPDHVQSGLAGANVYVAAPDRTQLEFPIAKASDAFAAFRDALNRQGSS